MTMVIRHYGTLIKSGDKRKYLTIVGPGDSLQSPGIIAKWGGIKGYPPVVGGFGERQSNIYRG